MLQNRIREGLTFDDVLLVPAKSEVLPRDVDLSIRLAKNIKLNIPMMSAAMDTVTEAPMAIAMALAGGIGCIHKNLEEDDQAKEVAKVKTYLNGLIAAPVCFHADDDISFLRSEKRRMGLKFNGFPVLDSQERLVGMITSSDMRFAPTEARKLRDVMQPAPITAKPGTSLKKAYDLMRSAKVSKLPLVDRDGRVVGLYSFTDVQRLVENKNPTYNCDDKYRLRVSASVSGGKGDLTRMEKLADAGGGKLLHSPQVAAAAGDGRRDAQAEALVAVVAGVGVLDDARDVGEAVEADDAAVAVDERQLADLRLAHELICLLQRGGTGAGDRARLHHVLERHRVHRREAHVGRGDHADELVVRVEHREAVELQPHAALFGTEEGDVVVGMEADRLRDKPVEVVLHLRHLRGLVVLLKILVDAADAAGERHRDRHRRLGDGIHRGGDERRLHLRARGKFGLQRGLVGQEISVLRDKRDVVVRQPLVGKRLHESVHVSVHTTPPGAPRPF